jgi:hypothetical protein
MKKFLIFLVVLAVFSLAIMFNWFDGRHWADRGLEATESAVDSLKETGDKVSETVDAYRSKDSPPGS